MSYEYRLQNTSVTSTNTSSVNGDTEDLEYGQDTELFNDESVYGKKNDSMLSDDDSSFNAQGNNVFNDAELFLNLVQIGSNDLISNQVSHQNKSLPEQDIKLNHARYALESAFSNAEALQTKESVTELSESKALHEGLFDRLSREKMAQDIRFSVEFSSGRHVEVKANNLPNKWEIALMVSDPELKTRLQELHKGVSSSLEVDFEKNVDLQVI